MARLIKRDAAGGDNSPDSGLEQERPDGAGKIISGRRFEAKADAAGIRSRAELEAQKVTRDVQQQASEIIANAHEEVERLKKEAHQQGYDQGRQEGAQELSKVVMEASRRLDAIEAQVIPQLKGLALTIARKILGRELEFHPEAVVDVVKQALSEKARQRREIVLRVNPDDLNEIREHKSELLELLSRCREIGIREDSEVGRFGVIIETDAGTIDAQLETQLAVFERVLKDTL
jgi:type III secretion protein L